MKTKAVDKKGKKRSLGETSIPAKPGQKERDLKSKKNLKKPKTLVDSPRNGKIGKPTNKNKQRALKQIVGQVEKQTKKAKQQDSAPASLKGAVKTQAKGTKPVITETQKETTTKIDKKLKILAKKHTKRGLFKKDNQKQGALVRTRKVELSMEQLKSRIETIMSREALSKTAKKKLSLYNRKLRLMESGVILDPAEKNTKKDVTKSMPAEASDKKVARESNQKTVNKKKKKKEAAQLQSKKAKNEPEEDSNLIEEDDEDDEDKIDAEEDESMDIDDFEEENDDDEVANEKKNSNKMKTTKKKEAARPFAVGALVKTGKLVGGIQKKKKDVMKPLKKKKQNAKALRAY